MKIWGRLIVWAMFSFALIACTATASASTTLSYDDGSMDEGIVPWSDETGSEVAVRFTPTSYPASLHSVQFYVSGRSGEAARTLFAVRIYDDDNGSYPGSQLDNGNITDSATNANQWVTIDVSQQNITISEGGFFVSMYWLTPSGSSGQNMTQTLGLDTAVPIDGRSVLKWGGSGSWHSMSYTPNGDRDAMIRVILGNSAGSIRLPKTGQTTCYDANGNVISCEGTGQDGDYQAGVAWPEPRFTDNGDGTITDNLTGLMWLKDMSCFGYKDWEGALDVIEDFNTNPFSYTCGGYSVDYDDWRLPNVNELESLMNTQAVGSAYWLSEEGFLNVQYHRYWSSTTKSGTSSDALPVNVYSGTIKWTSKDMAYYVAAVRGTSKGPAPVWKTGQTQTYAKRDDGALQEGVAWPNIRFTDNGDGTVTDNLTGLMWLKDANCFGSMNWQEALNNVSNFNANPDIYRCDEYTARHTDWRLPNRKELHSLTDFSKSWPALPDNWPFQDVHMDDYWSSTTFVADPSKAWVMFMWHGYLDLQEKSFDNLNNCVWPVRTAEPDPDAIEWATVYSRSVELDQTDFPGLQGSYTMVLCAGGDGIPSTADMAVYADGLGMFDLGYLSGGYDFFWTNESIPPPGPDWQTVYTFEYQSGSKYKSKSVDYTGATFRKLSAPEVTVSGNTISWNTVPYATKYRVYLHPLNDEGNPDLGVVVNDSGDLETTIYTFPDTIASGDYCFRVMSREYYAGYLVNTAFIIKKISLDRSPSPDIKANGSDGPVTVSSSNLYLEVSLDTGSRQGELADWWIIGVGPFEACYSYVYPTGWSPGIKLGVQTGLFTFSSFKLPHSTFPAGDYTFYFALDDPDGAATGPCWGLDSVKVSVKPDSSADYYEVYGVLNACNYDLDITNLTLVGTSAQGHVFNVAGCERFLIHVPSTSGKIRFDAIKLDQQWIQSSGDCAGHHLSSAMGPTDGSWSMYEWVIEGPPDGRTIENTVGQDSYYGFGTLGATNMTVYLTQ